MNDFRKLDLLALTPREEEVVDLVRQGRGNADIARQCSIAIRTVKRHLLNVFNKVGCSNRAEMIYMLDQNLASELQTRLDVAKQNNSDLANRVAELQTQLTEVRLEATDLQKELALFRKLYDRLVLVSVRARRRIPNPEGR